MRVAIIGAAGFIGTELARNLLDCGHQVTGIDVVYREALDPGESFHCVDVTREAIRFDSGTDAVFYLAQSPFSKDFPSQAPHLFGVNTMGAIKAVHAACEAKVRFLCYASTGNVYAPAFHAMAEDHPVRRDEPYALSKVMAEDSLALFRGLLRPLSVRLFGVFGPGQKDRLPTRLLNLIRNGEPIILKRSSINPADRDGLVMSYSYVGDVVSCLVRLAGMALDGDPLPPKLNIAGPDSMSLYRFCKEVGKAIGKDPVFKRVEDPRSTDLIADTALLRSLLGPSFTPLNTALSISYGEPRA